MRFIDHPAFEEGRKLHNAGAFWDAHEAWETLWREESDPVDRAALQGLIQVTAAFHKLFVHRRADAALRILRRGVAKLDGLAEVAGGIDLDAFRDGAVACATVLATGGDAAEPDRFDRALVPRLLRATTRGG